MRSGLPASLWLIAILGTGASQTALASSGCSERCLDSLDARLTALAPLEARLRAGNRDYTLHPGETFGPWTLTEALADRAVFEKLGDLAGPLFVLDLKGSRLELQKTAEATRSTGPLLLGHTAKEVLDSSADLLGREILAGTADPDYARVASVFEPLRNMSTYSFVGTPDTVDKIGFEYGGRSPDVDPAVWVPAIRQIRAEARVLDGLVGGYLPVLRFVYPEAEGTYTEMLAFAPFRRDNGNNRLQPVWYRILRVQAGKLAWIRYIDSYQPFPPRLAPEPAEFYRELIELKERWNQLLAGAMRIDLPDEHMANMARFALVRDLMTRVGDYPKYGVVDKNYADSQHDGFPDTFNVDMAALNSWGLTARAGAVLDNYLGHFVRDDGSLLYRGPEIGQYGRMLTEVAHYVRNGGDPVRVLRWRTRIDAIAKLLLSLRAEGLKLDRNDAAYGLISGWSEADACLDPEPQRYMQPYFSNSAEAVRGFDELGQIYVELGRDRDEPLRAWGEQLQREAAALRADLNRSLERSVIDLKGEKILPAIAGVRDPFHIAVPRDPTDPQFRSYRGYMELLYSGLLTREQTRMVVDYRARHYDTLLGMPTSYGYRTSNVAAFLSYGHGYGLIQHDFIREALLLAYSNMAHEYTRGTWMAPETRNLLVADDGAPYATPAQLMAALMTRWLLVFEDPESTTLWLGKGVPREWLADGKRVQVDDAPTRYGRVGFALESHVAQRRIVAVVQMPQNSAAHVRLRLRAPLGLRLESVRIDGEKWQYFDADSETVDLPQRAGSMGVEVRYRH